MEETKGRGKLGEAEAAEKWTVDFTKYAKNNKNATIQECVEYACKESAKYPHRYYQILLEDLFILGDADARINY